MLIAATLSSRSKIMKLYLLRNDTTITFVCTHIKLTRCGKNVYQTEAFQKKAQVEIFLSLTLYRRNADRFIQRPSPYRAVNTFHLG